MNDDASRPKRRRRSFTLNLRTLFVLITVACVLLGWHVNGAWKQRAAVAAIRELGGRWAYDYEIYQTDNLFSPPKGEPPGPAWLRDLIGIDFFTDVVRVDCGGKQIKNVKLLAELPRLRRLDLSSTNVNDVTSLGKLTNLHILELRDTQVSDVASFERLTQLEYLQLSGTQVSDVTPLVALRDLEHLYLNSTRVRDVSPLMNLKNLEFLGLNDTDVSEVASLANLTSLKWLDLRGTQVREEEYHELQQALPTCNIEYIDALVR